MNQIKTLLLSLFVIASSMLFSQSQNALNFDGVDDYIDCGNDASLNITGAITIETWVYLPDVIQQYDRFVEKDWATSYYLGSSYNAGGLAFCMDANGNDANVLQTAPNILDYFIWMHVAGTWDGSTMKIYINGELEASMPWTNVVTGSTNSVLIGKYYGNSDQNFKGDMDEVRIWDVARTEQEIRDNMYKELDNPASETNLVAYYRFNEGAASHTSADLSQNNNTAVLGGTLAIEATDPAWIVSTAPIPYVSVLDGIWEDVDTWAFGQGWPFNSWAIVEVNHTINVTTNDVAGTLSLLPTGEVTVDPTFSLDIADDFIIKSTAVGTGSFINNGTFTYGSASVERYYAGSEWHLISSPITSAVSGLFTDLYLQSHDEATNSYSDIIPTNVLLNPGQGYALWNDATATATFTGSLNTGVVGSSGNVARSGAGYVDFGWNLVGNPYSSAIDWDAASGWTKTNVDNATYIHRNASTWATYVGGAGTNGGSQFIATGQGFFVSVTDNAGAYPESGTLLMDESVQVHENPSFFKNTIANLLRLEISGNEYSDETVIRFHDEATVDFDGNWDAHKIFGYVDEAANIYSYSGEQKYSINALPELQSIGIGVSSLSASEYEITATEVNDLETVLLEDKLTGSITNLLETSYFFTYDEYMDERFIIHFSTLSVIEDPSKIQATIFAYQNNIICHLPEATTGSVSIYQINGQLVKTTDLRSGKISILLDHSGTYIVKVITNSSVKTQKITLR